jgi:tetratricopeptide (TPR) repeat protein
VFVALRSVLVLAGGLMLGGASQGQSAAIGPLVAPAPGAAALTTPNCATLAKNCDKRAPPVVASDVDELARLVQAADDFLFAGDEKSAWIQLNRALRIDPGHRAALLLMSQITDDPRKLLGELTDTHVPRPGETLRQIAAARLGDARWFFALARYNGIEVPRALDSTRSLRVPPIGSRVAPVVGRSAPTSPSGRLAATSSPAGMAASPVALPPAAAAAPTVNLRSPPSSGVPAAARPPGAAPAAASGSDPVVDAEGAFRQAAAAEKSGRIELAYVHYMRAFTLGHPGAGERAAAMRQELISRHKRAARTAQERGDLDRAYRAWRNVQELDPDDSAASAEVRRLQQQARKDAARPQ